MRNDAALRELNGVLTVQVSQANADCLQVSDLWIFKYADSAEVRYL